ncbi:hypothetical protein XA68_12346 [Ophiocordyceps unilateralis]|uniref:carboxypeptidase C n=1 Tax=Ophiocordyceps unilateralis TaxID=268505 RepID=A0A2A9PUP4_OPHUN|nr:hypothetical protein XA68_12346 [Ophiocordyceps unilateralis]
MRFLLPALVLAASVGSVASEKVRSNTSAVEPAKQADSTRTFDTLALGVDTVRQFSGYLDDEKNDKHLFYWFFESRGDAAKDPVILWVEGGPGCSSMLGLFQQVGPANIKKNLTVASNPLSWTNRASIIFLDQPANTGFSHTSKRVTSTAAGAKDVVAAMRLFFKKFPEYAKQDFYIAGTSYSGHHVPVFAAEILSQPDSDINLKGAIIGNGLTDAKVQFQSYRPMACGEGGIPAVINETTCQAMQAAEPKCQEMMQACYDTEEDAACLEANSFCEKNIAGRPAADGINIYNLRKECIGNFDNFCTTSVEPIDRFLNQAKTQKALGVEDVDRWEVCSSDSGTDIRSSGDGAKPHQRDVTKALEKIPVLVFAGDGDYICNWLGNRDWTNALDWPGHHAFDKAEVEPLNISSGEKQSQYGEIKSASGLTFARIFNAGHFAIEDQPEGLFDLFSRWMDGEWDSK